MIKCLTLHQPWATLMAIAGHQDPVVAALGKKIETRTRPWSYCGLLGIASSKHWDRIEKDWVLYGTDHAARAIRHALEAAGYRSLDELPMGAVLCVGNKVDCIQFANLWCPPAPECYYGHYATGRYGYVLEEIRSLPTPIKVTGFQGPWTPPPDVAERLERFYKGAAA